MDPRSGHRSRPSDDVRPSASARASCTLAGVFVRYFVELPLRSEDAEDVLLSDPESWLPVLADTADERGERLLAEVGVGSHHRTHAEVALEFGTPLRMPSKTILPFRWTALRGAGLFPALDADLEVAPLGTRMTQLAISARYTPPLGVLGRAIDRAVMHRIAEATLKDFLDRVAAALAKRLQPLR